MAFFRPLALIYADVLTMYSIFVLSTYLTDVWKLSITHAAGIVNLWIGISLTMQTGFLYLAETLLGYFIVLLFSSIAYCIGLGFLAMSTPPVLSDLTGTCRDYKPECIGDTQKILFYLALPLMAVGMSGHSVTQYPFALENFIIGMENDDDDDDSFPFNDIGCSCNLLMPFKAAGFVGAFLVPVIAVFALPYIKPWSLRFGIPAICVLVATLFFLSGTCSYRWRGPQGSPFTNMMRVIVASACKMKKQLPEDPKELHEENSPDLIYLPHTRRLRCLDKAAIKPPAQEQEGKWRLCRVTEVEETKLLIRILPMWLIFACLGVVISVGNSYFVVQADSMNPKIGKWKVSLQVFQLIYDVVKDVIFIKIAQKLLEFLTRLGIKRYAPAVTMALAMVFSILCCVTAAKVEARRLDVIRTHNLLDKADVRVPMSMFWLVPQYLLLAGIDSFIAFSIVVFLAPLMTTSMPLHFLHFHNGIIGLGYMGSVLSVYVVGKISEKGGDQSWFQYTLNRSRLDNYYWALAVLSAASLVLFSLVAIAYPYKAIPEEPEPADNGFHEEVSGCFCWYTRRVTGPGGYYEEFTRRCCFTTSFVRNHPGLMMRHLGF